MNTILNTLFNSGNNDGDISINIADGNIKCHSFILKYCTDNMNENVIDLPIYTTKQLSFLLSYMYNGVIPPKDGLSQDDIINIFKLIQEFKCKEFINNLKNDLATTFVTYIKLENWFQYFDQLYGTPIYKELNDKLLEYYSNNVLTNENLTNENSMDFMTEIRKVKNDAVYDLLMSTIRSFVQKNVQQSVTETTNKIDEEEDEEDIDKDGDANDASDNDENDSNTDDDSSEYAAGSIGTMLKNGYSFKDIAAHYNKLKEEIIIDFFRHCNTADRNKTAEAISKKYGIVLLGDRAAIKKLKDAQSKIITK